MNISSNYFIYINIAVAIIYLVFIVIGYKKGFLYELISLIYTGISIAVAWFIAPVLGKLYPIFSLQKLNSEAELVSKFINIDAILNTFAYFTIVFLILKLFYIVLALVLKSLNKIPVIGSFNQILGAVAGIINATVITLALSLLLSLPAFKNGEEIKNGTVFKYVCKYSDSLVNYVVKNVNLDHIKEQFDSFDVENARNDFEQWLDFNKNE